MKIEKLNDNQIRCTLTRADLADREIKISELVCGTEKAKSLFQDMMRQASKEFGFEAEDMPLMIEAVPAASDSIVLIITRVDDPEELDSRFSKFGGANETDHKKRTVLDKLEGAEEILDLINKVKDAVTETAKQVAQSEEKKQPPRIRLFSFSTLDCVILASRLLKNTYDGQNTLYKDVANDIYVLALSQSDYSSIEFSQFCNMLHEYGCPEKISPAALAYLEEHCETIVSTNAVQQLGSM